MRKIGVYVMRHCWDEEILDNLLSNVKLVYKHDLFIYLFI